MLKSKLMLIDPQMLDSQRSIFADFLNGEIAEITHFYHFESKLTDGENVDRSFTPEQFAFIHGAIQILSDFTQDPPENPYTQIKFPRLSERVIFNLFDQNNESQMEESGLHLVKFINKRPNINWLREKTRIHRTNSPRAPIIRAVMQSIEQMHSDIYSLYPSSIPAFLAIYTLAGDVGFGTSIRKVHERLYHLDRLGKPVFEEHQVLSNGTSDYIQIDHTKTFERSSGGKKGKCPARSYVRKILQPEINLAIQKIHALGYRADPDINRFNDILDSSKQRLDIFHPLRDQVTQRYLSITS